MHIFLTGEIGSGKSYALRRTLFLLGVRPGGFLTYFGPDRAKPDRLLYLSAAGEPPAYGEEHVVARFSGNAAVRVHPERFDGMGTELLRAARREFPLVVMDECGYLERDARAFQDEVVRCLDGKKPVLGVVRLREDGWTERIRLHPNVEVLTVTEENRDGLPGLLFEHYRHLT
jgi:nucleoside-triphosphatase